MFKSQHATDSVPDVVLPEGASVAGKPSAVLFETSDGETLRSAIFPEILPTNVGPHLQLPSVSVCIGCFNQEAFIESAIRSVAAQTYSAFECVVVDDMSTDGSRSRIEACLEQMNDSRFRFLPQPENLGQMATLMTGLDATSGPLVSFLDGDDAWHPEFLERHVRAHLSPAGAVALSSSDELLMDAAGVMLAGSHPSFRVGNPEQTRQAAKYVHVDESSGMRLVFVHRTLIDWWWSTTSGMMFRRDVITMIRPPDPERIRICADEYLAFGAHMLGGTVRIEQVLGSYRLHGKNAWADGRVLGSDVALGAVSLDNQRAIRRALTDRWCSIASELEPIIPRQAMRRPLVNLIGWKAAFELHDGNHEAGFLLKGWATPRRRILFNLARILPSGLKPSYLRSR